MAASQILRLALAGVALAAVGVVGPNMWVARAAGRSAYAEVSAIPPRSVAIVPGTSVSKGQPLEFLKGRLETALALYKEGRVKAILVSGNDSARDPEVTVMRAWLAARGVAPEDIWLDEAGSRTRETMLNAATRFKVTDAIICTQDLYVRRTLFLAREAGIDAVGVGLPTDLPESPRLVGTEALKTTLAVIESLVREGPAAEDRDPGRASTTLAVR